MVEVVGILLAAGFGSRFGGDKLSYPLHDGTPIACAAANSLQMACDRVVAVVRPDQDRLAELLSQAGCEVVRAPEASGGMGHSLAAGVRAARDAAGWLVALADMPYVAAASHRMVACRLRAGDCLVAPTYRGKRGHPVGFSSVWLAQLLALQGDEGARAILGQHRQQLSSCPVDDPGVLRDIDHRQDLEDQRANTG